MVGKGFRNLLFLALAIVALAFPSPISAAPLGEGASFSVEREPPPITPPVLLAFEPPTEIEARDLPNDAGNSVIITWRRSSSALEDVRYTVYFSEGVAGPYKPLPFDFRPIGFDDNLVIDNLQYFRYERANRDYQYVIMDFTAFDAAASETYDRELKEYKKQQKLGNPVGPEPVLYVYDWSDLYFKLGITTNSAVRLFDGPPLHAVPVAQWFDWSKFNNLVMAAAFLVVILFFIETARRRKFYIRRIAGLDAVDEAIGRATEMGRPIFYLCGLDPMTTVSTIAATNLLGHVAKAVANYESQIKVPCFDPIVMSVCQETVREAYYEAGRPDAYNSDNVFFITSDQFSYVAAVNGMMVRERPAANFFFGYYYAESLLLGEVGQSTGAIQIAGTDSNVQIPFFITSCDYVLIGEELYAASAYISREPKLLGSVKASDMAKAVIIVVLLLGLVFSVALLVGALGNGANALGGLGEKMEYFMELFNEHI
ncbi:MAG: hypothetical protein A2Y63_05370 [Candidatus Riflebacteria bacterium RBG_13_59_9]|nr:MAG: hypothetical protein A2Y63_05370 [Candidatus Riflebacteria bacterium RBG_13_59_9]